MKVNSKTLLNANSHIIVFFLVNIHNLLIYFLVMITYRRGRDMDVEVDDIVRRILNLQVKVAQMEEG